jgi:hypothetical protein
VCPGALGDGFYDITDATAPFNQKHIAGPEFLGQAAEITQRRRGWQTLFGQPVSYPLHDALSGFTHVKTQ